MSWPTGVVEKQHDYRYPVLSETLFDEGKRVLLLGTSGIGKTTVLRRIQEKFSKTTLLDLGTGSPEEAIEAARQVRGLLLLDEAQHLVTQPWRERDISELDKVLRARSKKEGVVLAGWPLLEQDEAPRELKRLLESLHVTKWVEPLTKQQTASMVRRERSTAPFICGEEVVEAIYQATAGFPNIIARFCDFLRAMGKPLRVPVEEELLDFLDHCAEHASPFKSFQNSLASNLRRCLEAHANGANSSLAPLYRYGVVAEDRQSLRGELFKREWRPVNPEKSTGVEEVGGGRGVPTSRVAPSAASQSKARTILTVATEWFSAHGGLSTFNRELSMALAKAGHAVYCYVPGAREEEREHGRQHGVTLVISPGPGEGVARLSRRPTLPAGVVPDVIIGHGRITGGAALVLVDHFPNSHRVHFLHVAPSQIEWFKVQGEGHGAAEKAEERDQVELELTRGADIVVAVGPRLQREYARDLHPVGCTVRTFIPGLREVSTKGVPPGDMQILLLGRAEDEELKGLDIAARAVALLAPRLVGQKVQLAVRGAPVGTGDTLREKLYELAGRRDFELRVKPYSSQEGRILEDIQQSSLVLMPSRSEGFGLVGLEAIAAGVPVLLSDKSGLAEFIQETLPEMARHHVVVTSQEMEGAAEEWSRSMQAVLFDRKAAFQRVLALRQELVKVMRWEESVAELLRQLPPPREGRSAG